MLMRITNWKEQPAPRRTAEVSAPNSTRTSNVKRDKSPTNSTPTSKDANANNLDASGRLAPKLSSPLASKANQVYCQMIEKVFYGRVVA